MDNFNIEINDQLKKTKSFFSGPKIIFVILGAILIVEFVYAVKTLTLPTPPPVVRKATIQKGVGKITLNVPKTVYRVNEVIPVSVRLDSGGRTLDGADLIIRFDPRVLEATPGSLIAGSIFDEYPLLSADMKKGLVSVSGVNSTRVGFKGTGQFITVNFKARAKGNTSLIIDFEKGSTSDSNLVETGTSKDILEEVGNLELSVQ